MLKKIRGSAVTLILFLIAGLLFSCSKDAAEDKSIVPLSQVDDAFLQGQFFGKYAGQPVVFTFRDGKNGSGTVDMVVSLGKAVGGNLIVQNGHYEIIKEGINTRLLELSGDIDAHLVWLVASVTPAGQSDIGNAGTTAGNATDGYGQDFTKQGGKHATFDLSDPAIAALGTGDTDWLNFPIFIEGAFTQGGKKGLSIKFTPSSAYFGKDEATVKTALESAGPTGLNIDSATKTFNGTVKNLSTEPSDYLQK